MSGINQQREPTQNELEIIKKHLAVALVRKTHHYTLMLAAMELGGRGSIDRQVAVTFVAQWLRNDVRPFEDHIAISLPNDVFAPIIYPWINKFTTELAQPAQPHGDDASVADTRRVGPTNV